jgi:hypothetical protein
MSWGQPEPFSGQTNPREERPATQPGRSTLQRATHAIWSSGLVPDTVASVSLYYAKTPSQDVSTIIAKATRVITATVINNVYVVHFRNHGRPGPSAVVYRTASGAVLASFDADQ